jgi:protein-S-isoprenylcysteine O-methyltransferase Ste14
MVDAYNKHRGLEMILWLVSQSLMVGFAVFRATPKNVTTNPVYWLIELAAFGSWFLYWAVREDITPAIAPQWVTAAIAILGLAVLVSGRISLARSFGYLPAQREIRVAGIYSIIRHPLYVGILLNGVALLLRHFNAMMIVAVLINNFFFLLKALIEESYLGSHSPEYRAYMQRVRWRYIPYVF